MSLAALEGLETWGDGDWFACRAALSASGYSPAVIAEAESVAPGLLDEIRLPLVQWRLRARSTPAHLLARLFCYDDSILREEADGALTPALVDRLIEAGVLIRRDRPGGSAVASSFRLTPFDRLLVLSDRLTDGPECVMGPGPTTSPLARALDAGDRSVLDVGCGAGTLALGAAAAGARRVVGVDLNRRAIRLSRLNARLNGVEVDWAEGDLFAPVNGERFDRIVAQPPYVIHPPEMESVTFLHGGPTGEELALRLLSEAPSFSEENGRTLVFFDFPVLERPPLHQRLQSLMSARAVDLAVLLGPAPSLDAQAIGYASLQSGGLGPGYAGAVVRYRAHLESIGARSFARALVVLRARRAGASFSLQLPVRNFRLVTAEWLDRWLASVDAGAAPDEVLLQTPIALPEGAQWIEQSSATSPRRASLRLGDASPLTEQELSESAWALLSLAAGTDTVSGLLAAFAREYESPPTELRPEVLAFVREALARGLLISTQKL